MQGQAFLGSILVPPNLMPWIMRMCVDRDRAGPVGQHAHRRADGAADAAFRGQAEDAACLQRARQSRPGRVHGGHVEAGR